MKDFLEAGKIVNTHGIKGEVKIQPWADSPEFIQALPQIYLDAKPIRILSSKIHKGHLIARLEGIDDIDSAIRLKNKVIFLSRADVKLEEGKFFVQDIVGLPVITDTGESLGKLKDIISKPAQDIYVVEGDREYLIPDVADFILEKNLAEGYIKVRLIEGI